MQLNYIANACVPSSSGKTIAVLDPSDGQVFETIQRSNAHDIDGAVRSARDCLELVWGRLSAAERGQLLMRLAVKVAEHAEELALIGQRDCGTPTRQARADANALARCLAFYATAAAKLHDDTRPGPDGGSVMRWREPYGVTGHLIAWNCPLQIFGRTVGGALAAGNVCVVKPSKEGCLSLLRVAELAAQAGFPAGALNIVTGHGHEAGDALVRHPAVSHISFTGSASVGTLIQQLAAERHCPVTLALGGKSVHIVFADADLDAAVPAIVNAIVHNAGQTGSAGSRLLVAEAIYEPLLARLGAAFDKLRVGPAAMDLDLGPLIRLSQLQRVWDFLSDAHVAGIPVAAQGQIVDEAPESGFYQAPTLLRDVPPDHRLAQEDVLGPVLCAMRFRDEAHAVELANSTPSGLAASIWTADGARQLRMARGVRSAQVFINHYAADSGVALPFGGMKSSVDGREIGVEALHGFTTLKTVAFRHG